MTPRVPSKVLEGLLYALTLFGPFAFGAVEPWSLAVSQTLTFLLALGCLLRGPCSVPGPGAWFWAFPAGFCALAAAQLAAPAAADGPWPLAPFTVSPQETQASLLLWGAYTAVLWSVPQVLRTHEAARRYARVLFGMGVVIAAQGLLQQATGGGKLYWLRDASHSHSFGPYYNSDHAANLLLMCMAMGAAVLVSRSRRWPGVDGPPPDYVRRVALTFGGVLLVAGAVFSTGSRGAMLAVPLGGAVAGMLLAGASAEASARRRATAAALAAGVGVVVFTYRHVVAAVDAGGLVDPSVSARLVIYADCWRWLGALSPFGTGLGSFETVYAAYQDAALRGHVTRAHSDWLQLALESGFAGLGLALAAALTLGAAAIRTWRQALSSEMRALIAGAAAGTAAFAAHVLFEFSFQIPGNAVVFMTLAGFLLSAPQWMNKAVPKDQPRPLGMDAALTAGACFLVLTAAAVRPAASAWWASRPGTPPQRAASMVRGLDWSQDPERVRRLAAMLYRDSKEDVAKRRLALRLALAAAEARPYDPQALFLAGAILQDLGRPADAAVWFERARRGRAPGRPREEPVETDAQKAARKKAELSKLGLLPAGLEKR